MHFNVKKQCSGHIPHCIKGFTLIELLVVVSIIAILIALLLPSIKRSRSIARLVICQSNLGQIAIAFFAYAGDNQGRAPGYMEHPEGRGPNASDWKWLQQESDWPVGALGGSSMSGKYYAYIHDQWLIGGNPINDNNPSQYRPNVRKLNDYVMEAAAAFRCPADIGAINVDPAGPQDHIPVYERGFGGGGNSAWISGTSYPYNASKGLFGPERTVPWKRVDMFPNPDKQVTLADYSMFYTWLDPNVWSLAGYSSRYWAGHPWHDPPGNHPEATGFADDPGVMKYDRKANSAFADGHAATITFKRQLVTDEYIMWE